MLIHGQSYDTLESSSTKQLNTSPLESYIRSVLNFLVELIGGHQLIQGSILFNPAWSLIA